MLRAREQRASRYRSRSAVRLAHYRNTLHHLVLRGELGHRDRPEWPCDDVYLRYADRDRGARRYRSPVLRPKTSKPADGHKIYPYLLRNLAVEWPNQVWAMDITYIPMARGFVYLAAVVDWFSRRVLAWRLSITLEVEFCLDAVEEALARYGRPKIFNTDQGSQFTSTAFTGLLLENAIAISMDGRGSWRDVFVERLWRSVKYEEVYLRAYDSVGEASRLRSAGRFAERTGQTIDLQRQLANLGAQCLACSAGAASCPRASTQISRRRRSEAAVPSGRRSGSGAHHTAAPSSASVFSPLMACQRHLGLEAGAWLRRARLVSVAPDLRHHRRSQAETLSRRSQPPLCIPESLVKIYAFVVLLVLPLVYFLWLTATNSLADFLMRSWAGRPRHVYRYDAQLFRIHMKAKEDLRKFRSDTRRIIVEHELKLYKVRWQRYTTRVKRSWVRLRDLLWGR